VGKVGDRCGGSHNGFGVKKLSEEGVRHRETGGHVEDEGVDILSNLFVESGMGDDIHLKIDPDSSKLLLNLLHGPSVIRHFGDDHGQVKPFGIPSLC
jgi:hypothetical protein